MEESLDLWKVHETKNYICVHNGSIEIKSVALAQATCTIYSVLRAFVHCFEKNWFSLFTRYRYIVVLTLIKNWVIPHVALNPFYSFTPALSRLECVSFNLLLAPLLPLKTSPCMNESFSIEVLATRNKSINHLNCSSMVRWCNGDDAITMMR